MSLQSCKEHEEALVLVASGVAEATQEDHLRDHLAQCERCRAEFERLRRILCALEKGSPVKASTVPPQGMHARLMGRLRAEAPGRLERTPFNSWVEALRSGILSPRRAWLMVALGGVSLTVFLAVHWFDNRAGVMQSRRVATVRDRTATELERRDGQPAGPAELRRALVHSFDNFEMVLRRNDRLLAMREPVAVPSRERPGVERQLW